MRVAAVVVHYRRRNDVDATVRSVRGQSLAPERVLVVDNGSRDGSAEELCERYGDDLLALPDNRGYAAGANAGIRALLPSRPDAVLLLTHEVLLRPDALAALATRLDADARVGAVGPLVGLRERPDVVWSAGGLLSRDDWTVRHLGSGEALAAHAGDPYAVDWLDGCVILVRAEALRAVGPLDEGYFLYYEEADFLWRLGMRGWRVECVPAAVAWQQPGSPPRALLQRNRLRFARRAGGLAGLVAALRYDVREIRYGIEAGATKRAEARERIRGVAAYLAGRMP